ncbi:patatin-like phospholipase family protein [Prauserella muralis]|uniref:patatin-like phospholipase family protein n=1 Tax=Prauserella muralis TaxID=588067 RepID=UPI0011ADD7B3|nr:patatin-like phospholipase family protein [Prauserella muralis]TWE23695.1 putative acylesterase/phospholipase RssA [Prauserella muralis]
MRLAIVFSGGGAQAAYFGAGVALAVEDAGLRPDVLSGVSAGAINACALGTGMDAAALAEMWLELDCADLFAPRLDVWNLLNPRRLLRRPMANLPEHVLDAIGWHWLLDTAPARATFARRFGEGPLRIADGLTVVVSAVDQASAEVVRFTNALPPPHRRKPGTRQVALGIDHVLASAAAPLLFPPVRIEGRAYVDAGLVANTPLKPALAYEPDAALVVSASGIGRPAPAPASLGDAVGLTAENIAHFALLADLQHARTVNELAVAAPGATPKKKIDLLLVEPEGAPFTASGFLSFTASDAERLMAHGREVAAKALAEWEVAR